MPARTFPSALLTPSTAALIGLLVSSVARVATAQTVQYLDDDGKEITRRCEYAEWPKKLPALGAVLDSAALFAALDTVPAGETSALVLSVVHRDEGLPVVRLLEPMPPSPLALLVAEAAGSSLHVITPRPKPAGAIRVRMQLGAIKTAVVERSVYCAPEVIPASRTGPQTSTFWLGPGERLPSGGKIRVNTEVTIDDAGQVTDVKVIQGSGIRELDESLVSEARMTRYHPALLDGMRLASWVRSGGRKMKL